MPNGLFDPSVIYNYLQSQKLLPTWTKLGGSGGEYDYSTNRLVAPADKKSTMAHEMSHAAYYNLLLPTTQMLYEKKKKEKLTDQETQFLDAMAKIMLVGDYKSEDIGKTYKPNELYYSGKTESDKQDKQYNTYRTSIAERQAFGVGNMSTPGKVTDQGGLHFDPTMATEFSILMSLYDSLPNTVKQASATNRQTAIDKAREQKPNRFAEYPFIDTVDLFADPFKNPLK